VATLHEQVSREEKLKVAFEEFKRYEDERVERRCAELAACLDALSIERGMSQISSDVTSKHRHGFRPWLKSANE
nr:hypothetical protein [Tanacetum cinerariifolium]